MEAGRVIRALSALAQEHRLAAFRLLVQAGEQGVAAGVLAEVSVPRTHRWIPKGMQVAYVAKATTDIRATAVARTPRPVFTNGMDYPIVVDLEDSHGTTVVSAVISMWVTARPTR